MGEEPCTEIGADKGAAFGVGAVARGPETVSWREQIGMDIGTLTRSLSAVERYAILIREAQISKVPLAAAEESILVPAGRRLVATIKKKRMGRGRGCQNNRRPSTDRGTPCLFRR